MKRFFTTCIFFASVIVLIAGNNPLSLDSIVAGTYKPEALPFYHPMLDATLYSAVDESGKKLNAYDYKTGQVKGTILDLEKARGIALKKIEGYRFNSLENKLLVWTEKRSVYRRSWVTEYYVYDCKRNLIEPLSEKKNQREAIFSPDGRSIAFVSENNLYIKRLDYGTEIPVTTDGSTNTIINGSTDWVYEEEFMVTSVFDWSADSKYLAYLKFDERAVTDYTFTLYGANRTGGKSSVYYPDFKTFKYPSAGGKNSKVSVFVFHLQTRSTKPLSIPMDTEDYIPRIRFTCVDNQLAVMTLNRAQNAFRMYYLNVRSGVSTLVLTDQNDTYVDPHYDAIQFTARYFTYLSEKDGYRHLYLYNANGGLRKQLTSGNWDVARYLGCDTIKDRFYYQAATESPVKRSVWQVDLKGKARKISTYDGVCFASFNNDYTLFVQTASTINTPQRTGVYDLTGKELRLISDNTVLKSRLATLTPNNKIFITVPVADGQSLNGWLLKPTGFDASKKYPVVLLQYSGPDTQEALDQFKFDWEYYLAEKGFVVACVDGRGTGGRGAAFRRLTYPNLGKLESQDQIAVADYLKKQPYIDGQRIGIWGWSYGGYITLIAMTDKQSPFKAGIAVAPVCDYRYYNTIYTERYLKTPAENQEAYDACSPILRAPQLKGRLLLIHGLADDNVRANQSLDMAEALIEAGIRFDTQFYPTSSHSILGETYRRHLFNTKVEFFLKNL